MGKAKPRAPSARSLARRYVRECRALAYQCVEGTAPPFITDSFEESYGRCAIGWVLHRADPKSTAWDTFSRLYRYLDPRTPGAGSTPRSCSPDATVIDANNHTTEQERHGAVVFPLLWLADAVEAIAFARRTAARKSRPQKELHP